MKVMPRPAPALLVFALYLAVFYGVWVFNGIEYARIGESADTLLKWYVAPLAAGAAVLIVAVSVLGWWRPVLFEPHRAGPRWLWIGPLFMLCAACVTLASKDTSRTTPEMFAMLVLGSLGVGFCEEVATRGVLLTGFRARLSEPMAWFISTSLFGLLHLPNWLFGIGPAAIVQVVLAFLSGSVLYLARRLSGTLLLPIFIHGLWDFSGFVGRGDASLSMLLTLSNALLGVVFVTVLLRRERGQRVDVSPR